MYGFLIASAILLGTWLASKEEKRLGLKKDTMLDLVFYIIPLALVCARLYYVAFAFDSYKDDLIRIFYVWEGGLAIYGGVIGGMIGGYIFSKKRNIPFLTIADMVVPSLILGQAIGRWGNFFNKEAYGNLVENVKLQFFPYAVKIGDNFYQATFFYESMWDLATFILLYSMRKKWQRGDGLFYYFIFYGLGRSIIEGLRSDSLMFMGIRVSQMLSVLLIMLGIVCLLIKHHKHKQENK